MTVGATDIFRPVATGAPPAQITSRDDHPISKSGIVRKKKNPHNGVEVDFVRFLKAVLSQQTNFMPICSSVPKRRVYGPIHILCRGAKAPV
jgi:hypothetical protein